MLISLLIGTKFLTHTIHIDGGGGDNGGGDNGGDDRGAHGGDSCVDGRSNHSGKK
jgi:hypothetical protein